MSNQVIPEEVTIRILEDNYYNSIEEGEDIASLIDKYEESIVRLEALTRKLERMVSDLTYRRRY